MGKPIFRPIVLKMVILSLIKILYFAHFWNVFLLPYVNWILKYAKYVAFEKYVRNNYARLYTHQQMIGN